MKRCPIGKILWGLVKITLVYAYLSLKDVRQRVDPFYLPFISLLSPVAPAIGGIWEGCGCLYFLITHLLWWLSQASGDSAHWIAQLINFLRIWPVANRTPSFVNIRLCIFFYCKCLFPRALLWSQCISRFVISNSLYLSLCQCHTLVEIWMWEGDWDWTSSTVTTSKCRSRQFNV